MSNMKWIFSTILAVFVWLSGYLLHPVFQPCPEVSTGVTHDTLTFYFRDTVKVPVVKFVEKMDTVYILPDEHTYLSTKEYEDSVASVQARVWAPCEVDSIGLKVDVRPIIIERIKEVIVSDTIKTVIPKTSCWTKLAYTGFGALIGGAAVIIAGEGQ